MHPWLPRRLAVPSTDPLVCRAARRALLLISQLCPPVHSGAQLCESLALLLYLHQGAKIMAAAPTCPPLVPLTAAGGGRSFHSAHAILSCPRSAHLRGQFPDLFSTPSTVSLLVFFSTNDAGCLASFALFLYRLQYPATH